MKPDRVSIAPLVRVARDGRRTDQDLVAVEAPLSIDISQESHPAHVTHLGLFMRTPGDDEALAMGLLFAEGVIRSAEDVLRTDASVDADGASATLRITLAPHVELDAAALSRSGIATTACGLCGRLSAAAVRHDGGRRFAKGDDAPSGEPAPGVVFQLPDRLRAAQAVFAETGGLHAAGFFDRAGTLLDIAEDVGRHNAVDKLVGHALLDGRLPARDRILVVSGRVAYEIIQKASMAGVRTLVAVGAPTSLAVQAARDTGITLIGFAKDGSYNVYG